MAGVGSVGSRLPHDETVNRERSYSVHVRHAELLVRSPVGGLTTLVVGPPAGRLRMGWTG